MGPIPDVTESRLIRRPYNWASGELPVLAELRTVSGISMDDCSWRAP